MAKKILEWIRAVPGRFQGKQYPKDNFEFGKVRPISVLGHMDDKGTINTPGEDVQEYTIAPIDIEGGAAVEVLNFRNTKYRHGLLMIAANPNPTSYDFDVTFLPDRPGVLVPVKIQNDQGATLWQVANKAGTSPNIVSGELPQGNGIFSIRIKNDDGLVIMRVEGVFFLSQPNR